MAETRSTQQNNSPSRQTQSESVFTTQDLWYFKTREGEKIGPFRYRSEAQSNLDHFMEQLKHTVK